MRKAEFDDTLFLGVDGGGTKCRAIVASASETLGTGLSGPANPMHGFEQSTASIIDSAQKALSDAGLDEAQLGSLVAGVGLAGVNVPRCYQAMLNWDHPFKQMFVTTDLHIACLGAHNGEEGAVIIAGTGSTGYVMADGCEQTYGGYGFPHGDKGSGAWIGLEAVKHCLLVFDGMAQKSLLFEKILSYLDCQDATSLVEAIMPIRSSQYASLAPLVFEVADESDEIALQIINEAAEYMSTMARKLLSLKPVKLSVLGGLAYLMTPWLDDDIQPYISTALMPPEGGAVLYSKQALLRFQEAI